MVLLKLRHLMLVFPPLALRETHNLGRWKDLRQEVLLTVNSRSLGTRVRLSILAKPRQIKCLAPSRCGTSG